MGPQGDLRTPQTSAVAGGVEGAEAARDPAPTNVTHRITALLALVGRTDGGIGPREAARVTGIDRSAVSRIFNQLESVGWVEEVDERGVYTVGPELFGIAAAIRQRDSLGCAARPVLQALTDRFRETSYLAVRHAHQVVFEDRVDCSQRLRYVVEVNEPFPLTTGAAGRAILSALPRDEARQVIAADFSTDHPSTAADLDEYHGHLDLDRRQGYAYSRGGKWVVGGAAVASPIFDAAGTCAGAIVISAPIDRLPPGVAATLGPAVRDAARGLSHRLGFAGLPWGEDES